MKRKFIEEVTLFASVIKWSFYAAIVGVLVGIGTAVFLSTLNFATSQFSRIPEYYLFLPITLLASSLLVKWLAPDAAGHGTEKVIEAVHKKMGDIPLMVVPVKLVATVITLAGGGSAGKEGPCAQIGAGLASAFGKLLRLNAIDRRKLVICGISAGFATIFGTPIAGALFGVEVLVLGQVMYDVLFPSFVAGIIGFHVATRLGVEYPHLTASIIPPDTGWSFFEMILLGAFCGLIALFFIEIIHLIPRFIEKIKVNPSVKVLSGGAILAIIGKFGSTEYIGLGLKSIEAGLRGEHLPVASSLIKAVTTSITLACGGSGGVITPIFYIGVSAGNLFAYIFNEPLSAAFSGIGMVALLAGAANTPIAASILAIELFGAHIAPHAAIACMVSFLIVGHRSIYPSQILGIQKSSSLKIVTGKALSDVEEAELLESRKSIFGFLSQFKK